MIKVFVHTVFERNQTYTVPVSGKEVDHVSALGQDQPVNFNNKGGANFSLIGVEHCVEDSRDCFTFDGSGKKTDMSKYTSFTKTEIPDHGQFAPAGVLVVPPDAHASTVVRAVLADVIKPVQAQVIQEEKVTVEALDINFRPVYALEYEWVTKGKRVVLEFDGLTGEVHTGGKKLSDHIKGVITSDLIFEVTADAVGLLVPGGSIAVKLVKAVVDRGK